MPYYGKGRDTIHEGSPVEWCVGLFGETSVQNTSHHSPRQPKTPRGTPAASAKVPTAHDEISIHNPERN